MAEQGKPPDFSNLTENLTQQQAKISALKELVRQSESQQSRNTASTQEKVKNIAQRLSNLKSKSSKAKYRSTSDVSEEYGISNIEEEGPQSVESSLNSSAPSSSHRARSETPGSEKITLLRKQMELNRAKMAERESKSKEIEQMVTQLKSKFETSQMDLEKSVELGRSMGDLSSISLAPLHSQSFSDVSHSSRTFNVENERIKFLEKRVRQLEETINENDNLTESDKVQKLEGKILDLEENLREKESIIEARTKAVSLLSENLTKKKKDVVDSLEDTKQEMFKMQETFLDAELSYKAEVDRLNKVIKEKSNEVQNLNEKCEILEKSRYDLTIENSELKTKLEDVQDYSAKISELNKLNETLQKQISNLESQRYDFITEDEVGEMKHSKESSDKSLEIIKSLEESMRVKNEEFLQLEESLQEKTVELNVVNANFKVLQDKYNSLGPKSLFPSDAAVDEEVKKLKQQLDDSNKTAIKTKLKIKQLEKQVNSFKKSDSNHEVTRLTEEVQTLTQRIAELEENKGDNQWQEWGAETESELEKKIKVLETTCQNQTSAIQLLEEQKIDIAEDLNNAKHELETVKEHSELSDLEKLNVELSEKVNELTSEKEAIEGKLKRYVNENMELHEKIDKLSKGSSAESIEMVNLTAQENEEYQKALVGQKELNDGENQEISQELNESLRNLREESSELMSKIELFTIERREVLDKLDTLTVENQVLVSSIESIREEKVDLEHANESLRVKLEQNETLLSELQTEKEDLSSKASQLIEQRSQLQEEINKLVKEGLESSPAKTSSPTVVAATSQEMKSSIDRETCEKLLKQLDSEIQNLNKNKDKHQKLKISKKLSENAKSVHAMMTNLLVDYYKSLEDCSQLREDLERVKYMMGSMPSIEKVDDDELHNLQRQFTDTEKKLEERNEEIQELQAKLNSVEESSQAAADEEVESLKLKLESMTVENKAKDDLTEKLQEMIDVLTNERDQCEAEVQNQRTLVNDLRKEFDELCADAKVNNQKLNEKSSELDHLQREFDMRLKTSTSEVEILKTLVAEQKQLLIDAYQEHELDINQKIKEINDYQNQVKQMEDELATLRQENSSNQQSYANDLNTEVVNLKKLLDENNKLLEDHKEELLHKQETIDTLNNQIIDLYKTMEENSNKIIEKEDDLQMLQEISESSRDEIRSLHQKVSECNKTISDMKNQLAEKSRENEKLQQKSKETPASDPEADKRVAELELELKKLETKNKEQLDKLKKFAANLKKKQAQCSELEEKLAAGVSHDVTDATVVNELKAQVIQYEEQLNIIKVENSKLNNNLQKSSAVTNDEVNELKQKLLQLESELNEKSRKIEDLQEKFNEVLEKNDVMEESLFDHQAQIQKLETEKMKLTESAKNLHEVVVELELVKKEREELNNKLQEHESKDKADDKKKMDKLKSAVVQLKHKLADKKKEVEDLTEELQKIKSQNEAQPKESEALNAQLHELQDMSSKILDETRIAYEHDIGILRQQLADLEASNRLLQEDKQRKLSLEGQLESFEMINVQLREKVANLEETIGSMESEKNSLQRERLTLTAELEEKVNEIACFEEAYERQANDLIEQDALIGQKLRETESDNFHLTENIKELMSEKTSLLQKLNAIEVQFASNSDRAGQHIAMLESDNAQLKQHIEHLQGELKKLQSLHEQALLAKHAEIDDMESDLSSQLQRIEAEKKTIQEALEKANDQIVDFQDEVVRLKDNSHTLEQARADLEREMSWLKLQNENYTQDQLENEQLRMQLMQSETEAENLRSQNDNLHENHSVEIMILRQQIADLEAMRSQVSQNQTDDQVMLQNENVKLKELLVEKDNEIQHKTIQLQMVSTFDTPMQAVNDPFASLMAAPPQQASSSSSQPPQDVQALEEKLKQTEAELARIHESLMIANMELDVQTGKVQDLLRENKQMNVKANERQSVVDNLMRTNEKLEASLERHKQEGALNQSTDDDKRVLETEIERLQRIVDKYEPAHVAQTVAPSAFSASSLFGDTPQASAASLFDDPFVSNIQPQEVVEEIIQPKKAYLCFENTVTEETQTSDEWLAELDQKVNQIKSLQAHIELMNNRYMEQSMELEAQAQNLQSYQERIRELESSAQPQQTSIAQYFDNTESVLPSNEQTQSMAALEIEDGWGWSGAEVSEVAHQMQQQTSLLSPRSDLEVRLQEQRDIVERLEREKNLLNEELGTLRDNSKKMMKKLKEYQVKIKEMESKAFRKSSSVESNDMDLVIQEEINSQIQKLEAKLKDFNAEKEKEHQEKENLLKRVDVLTAANERMIESKERQDNQMEMYQLKIRDLNQKLHNLENWGDDDGVKMEQTPAQGSPTVDDSEMDKNIQELNDKIKDMQVDYDELQALLEEEKSNNKILEERISKLSSMQQSESLKDEEIEKLTASQKQSSSQIETLTQQIQKKDHEIRELISKIDLLSNESSNIKTILDDLSTQIQVKTNENQELNQRLQNLETNNNELSRERKMYNDSIEQNFRQYSSDLEQQLQTLNSELQSVNAELQYKNSQINELSKKINESETTELLSNEMKAKDEVISALKTRLAELEKQLEASAPPSAFDNPQENISELKNAFDRLNQEKALMEHELQVLNDQVLASLEFEDKMKTTVLELDSKTMEIQMLKASLQKLQEQTIVKDVSEDVLIEIEKLKHEKEDLKSSIDLLNAQWSQAVEQRGNEVANSWKQHLEARETEFSELEVNLRSQLQNSNPTVSQDDKTSENEVKMRSIMESQEVEIVSLKEQLAIRSAEYASLSSKVDPYHQISTSMNVSPVPPVDSDRVPRSELDLALYMLHQRDMRLEEMTMELVRLLDERDQLQLRLSNSIRQTEEVRKKITTANEAESSDASKTTTPEKTPPEIFVEDEHLRAKLSELNTVRHVRDKAIQDEREQRFMDNISMLQRDIANIPDEAAARIVAGSSDQGQSPSSVLMNWILGKNPEN